VRDVVSGIVPPGVKPKVSEFVDGLTVKLGAQPLPEGTLKSASSHEAQAKPENFRRGEWEDLQ